MAVDTPSKPKKSKKDKKSKDTAEGADGADAEDDLSQICEIAKPLAVKKTGKHVLKLVKKGKPQFALSLPLLDHLEYIVHYWI